MAVDVDLVIQEAGPRTVNAVLVPEVFYPRVDRTPATVMPFLAAKLAESLKTDVARLTDAAADADAAVVALPDALQQPEPEYAEKAKAYADEVEADRATAAALYAHLPDPAGLDELAAIRAIYGETDADAFALLDEVQFTLSLVEKADNYGESSASEVEARYAGTQVKYRIRGGVAAPRRIHAMGALHRDATTHEYGVARRLFSDEELGVLQAFEWPGNPPRNGTDQLRVTDRDLQRLRTLGQP